MCGKAVFQFHDEALKELLGCVHVNMPWRMLPGYLDAILELGMNVELGFEAEALDRTSRREYQAAAERLRERGCRITMHGPFWDLAPGSLDPLVRQVSRFRLQRFFDLLEVFQPLQVVCHTGYDPVHHKGHREFWLDESVELFEPLTARAERLRIPLLLENVWEHDPKLHIDLFERIDSPWLGFCLDVGHQHSFSRTPLKEWLEALGGHLMEVHLHDNDGSHDDHLPVGAGTIDFALLFDFLHKSGKEPILTLEPHSDEHLSESLSGLKRIFDGLPFRPGAGGSPTGR